MSEPRSEARTMFGSFSSEGITGYGLGWWLDTGELVNVNGTDMVRCRSAIYEIGTRWKLTKQEALDEVAERAETIAGLLLAQAKRLREGDDGR